MAARCGQREHRSGSLLRACSIEDERRVAPDDVELQGRQERLQTSSRLGRVHFHAAPPAPLLAAVRQWRPAFPTGPLRVGRRRRRRAVQCDWNGSKSSRLQRLLWSSSFPSRSINWSGIVPSRDQWPTRRSSRSSSPLCSLSARPAFSRGRVRALGRPGLCHRSAGFCLRTRTLCQTRRSRYSSDMRPRTSRCPW